MNFPDNYFYANEDEANRVAEVLLKFSSRSFDGTRWGIDLSTQVAPTVDVSFEEILAHESMTSYYPLMQAQPNYGGVSEVNHAVMNHPQAASSSYQIDAWANNWPLPFYNQSHTVQPGSSLDNYTDTIIPNSEALVNNHHPPTTAAASSSMTSFEQTALPTPTTIHLNFRCQYHTPDGPCGELINGNVDDAYEHFAQVHVHPGSPPEKWSCYWQGHCGNPMLKTNFKRHIVAHLIRWVCPNCLRTYSRDDSARKHTRRCGGTDRVSVVSIVDTPNSEGE